jgi:hypothetical protein
LKKYIIGEKVGATKSCAKKQWHILSFFEFHQMRLTEKFTIFTRFIDFGTLGFLAFLLLAHSKFLFWLH